LSVLSSLYFWIIEIGIHSKNTDIINTSIFDQYHYILIINNWKYIMKPWNKGLSIIA
jgi:hypothetical protein